MNSGASATSACYKSGDMFVNDFPEWIEPMAATLTQERFTGPEWIFERKFDGIRLLAFKQGGDVVSSLATACRRTFPGSRKRSRNSRSMTFSMARSSGTAGDLRRVRHPLARWPRRDQLPLEERQRLLETVPFTATPARRVARRMPSRGRARRKAGKA